MTIARGTTVGPYEVLAHIGAGGMGDVWRARDKRIGRDVAVKVLNDSFAPGDERVLRFEQEARAAGALNHPGLVTIFDVGTTDGSPYIVMELLEGETLRDAIGEAPSAPLPLRRAVDYTIQIASALAVAHEKGIIHRDLKPENVFITSDGRVKILDFGLVKLAEDAKDADGRHRTGRHLTSTGMVVGTPGYMSPEQVRAQPLDYRTDIFSLGAVLYEMLGGRRAFDRDTAVETMNAVLKEEPPPIETNLPTTLESIVRHCMEKNPRERFQSARDLAFQLRMLPELQNSRTGNLRAIPEPAKRPRLGTVLVAAIAVLALAGVGFALYRMRGGAVSHAMPRKYKQLTFAEGLEMFPTLSPDGKTFAYVSAQSGNRDIYVQRVDGRTAIDVTSDSPADDSEPAFSPDGSQIAFRSEREGGGIFVMGVTGESVRRLTDVGHNPSWSPDGRQIVVATEVVELRPHVHLRGSDLWIVDARTGAKRPLLQARGSETDGVQPSWSPHNKRIAFGGWAPNQRDIWTIDPNAPQPKQTLVQVTSDPSLHWNPVWSPDGRYLYFGGDRDGTLNLWRVAIDEETGKPAGTPEPLSLPGPVNGHFAFSQQGEMAFTTVARSYRLLALPFDAQRGKTEAPRPLFGGSQEILTFEPSPDAKSIAFTTAGAQEDLFVVNADGSRMRQLTNDAARDRSPAWAPDGKTLYFYSNRNGGYHIWSIRTDGSGLQRVTDDGDLQRHGVRNIYVPSISPDGRTLAAPTDDHAALVHLDRPIGQRLETLATFDGPKWSADGQQLIGNPAANPGIVVYSLRTRRLEPVLDHGTWPQWLPDGRHIAFFDRRSVGIFDLDSHRVRSTFAPTDVDLSTAITISPFLSRDGSTLYVRQAIEQGDIWLVHFEK
jgi:Tol biopolymer transport system component